MKGEEEQEEAKSKITMLNPMGGGRGREVSSSSSENYTSEGEERMTMSRASEALLNMENKSYTFETREKSGIEWGILLGILVDTTAR